MKKTIFDPFDPPSAKSPFPTLGEMPSLQLLEKALRMTPSDRDRNLTAEHVRLLEEAKGAIDASMRPATAKEIGDHISALLLHYPPRALSPQERKLVAQDWITDFAAVPSDVLQAACQEWRRSPNAYAPTPGHLLELAKPIIDARRWRHRFAVQVLERLKARQEATA